MNLKLLIGTRKHKRKFVTETFNKKSSFSSMNETDRLTLKNRLNDTNNILSELNNNIQDLKFVDSFEESELENELSECDSYDLKIQQCLVLLVERHTQINQDVVSTNLNNARSLLKSPTAPLPKFSGDEGEDLHKFFNEFETTISKFNYTDYDKLLLLKQQLSGRAAILINSLDIKTKGFSQAKELLEKALASRDLQIFNIVKQISQIKLSKSDDPFIYMSKMTNLIENVKDLNIDVDCILQYFFWNGLNDDFKSKLTQIVNKSKPSLKEIQDNFFEASDRYLQDINNVQGVSDKSLKEVTGLAANVSYNEKKSKVCTICVKLNENSDHSLSKCQNFKSNESKLKQLKFLDGCVKCGNTNHAADRCRFRLNSKCFSCQGWHMTFLCPSVKSNSQVNLKSEKQEKILDKSKGTKEKSKVENKNTSNNLVIFSESWKSESSDGLILPTFVCLINGTQVRGFKDGGCQSNFISEKLAKSLQLKVIKENVSLSIKGINVQKNYDTKLLELNLQLGGKIFNIEAYCLPSININLDLPDLTGVASKFLSKNFKLADTMLTSSRDKIDNIEFILGVQSAYCLPETEIVFGNSGNSVYSESPIGTILKGNIDKLKQDLNFLDRKQDKDISCKVIKNAFAAGTDIINLKPDTEIDKCKNIDKFNDISVDVGETLVESDLLRATEGVLKYYSEYYIGKDFNNYEDLKSDLNERLIEQTLDWTVRDADGRLIMPLMWNNKVSHLLGKNYNLAKSILRSVTNKLDLNSEKMKLINDVFKTQEKSGIIQRIENLNEFMIENHEYSFLPFMGIFKLERETTKCRVVFLSNICEKFPRTR